MMILTLDADNDKTTAIVAAAAAVAAAMKQASILLISAVAPGSFSFICSAVSIFHSL